MRTIVVGLGGQGSKRLAVAGPEAVATVDPVVPAAHYRAVEQVPLDAYDAALVCTPDQEKLKLLTYLLSHGKHVLVEKPLLASHEDQITRLQECARSSGAACYTAYNHRFEPHIQRLKELLDRGGLGRIYYTRLFYGNGTAMDVKGSDWRDQGLGVLSDLGSHLLDLTQFMFAAGDRRFEPWSLNRFETRSFDHVLLGSRGQPVLELEATLLSWRNTFTLDVLGETGSAHINGLCKWGPSTLTVRHRVFPSGVPRDEVETVEGPDPTWDLEYAHFKELCHRGATTLENDRWINSVLNDLVKAFDERSSR